MAEKILDRVTVTGADNSVDPRDLLKIFEESPFVEFGILLSQKKEGTSRYPSPSWLEQLFKIKRAQGNLPLSGHLCGAWVRDICMGGSAFFQECGPIWRMFDRFQLNFHAEIHTLGPDEFVRVLFKYLYEKQLIMQMDGVNDGIYTILTHWHPRIDVVPLFDLSGGTGVLPKEWPQFTGYCGRAGGLSPDNLQEQMEKIAEVAGDSPIWVDAETHLRSQDDTLFDLDKVRRFLEIAKPWVINQD